MTLYPFEQAIWGHILEHILAKSHTNAINATMPPLRELHWGHTWTHTEGKKETRETCLIMYAAAVTQAIWAVISYLLCVGAQWSKMLQQLLASVIDNRLWKVFKHYILKLVSHLSWYFPLCIQCIHIGHLYVRAFGFGFGLHWLQHCCKPIPSSVPFSF